MKMKLSHEQKSLLKKMGIAVLAILVVGAIFWFVMSLRQSIKSGDLEPDTAVIRHREDNDNIDTVSPQRRAITIESIRPWMTFNYLNVVFKMPASYLKNALAITDTRYPNIRVDSYIRTHQLGQTAFFQAVKQSVMSYSAPK